MIPFLDSYLHLVPLLDGISLLLSAALLAAAINFIVKTGWLMSRVERIEAVIFKSDAERRHVEKSWAGIERNFFSGNDDELKLAILKADILLEGALRDAGVAGKDVGERLRRINTTFLPNLDNVWEAHKLRNRIAHETNLTIKRDLAERALTVYQQALEYLGALAPLKSKE